MDMPKIVRFTLKNDTLGVVLNTSAGVCLINVQSNHPIKHYNNNLEVMNGFTNARKRGGSRVSRYPGLSPETSIYLSENMGHSNFIYILVLSID